MQKVIIYTDGAARGNPGSAGIGIVIKNIAKGTLMPSPNTSIITVTAKLRNAITIDIGKTHFFPYGISI